MHKYNLQLHVFHEFLRRMKRQLCRLKKKFIKCVKIVLQSKIQYSYYSLKKILDFLIF